MLYGKLLWQHSCCHLFMIHLLLPIPKNSETKASESLEMFPELQFVPPVTFNDITH